MPKAILIILTLAGFASGAEFEVMDRLSVDGSSLFKSTAVFSGNVGIGTGAVSGVRLAVNSSTGTAYIMTVGTSTAYSLVVSTTGNVGIGTTTPVSRLEVAGGEIKISSSSAACTADNAGAIRWNGANFLGCDGTNWLKFDVQASPSITEVNPASGPVSGGTAITVTGSNFISGATVMIGGNAATGVIFDSAVQLRATTPAGVSVGAKDVKVINPDSVYVIAFGGFTYRNPLPTINSVSPGNGPLPGGTVITITGSNFVSGATVMIGGNAATGVIFDSAGQLRATTPAGTTGAKDVTIINPDSGAVVLPGGFYYGVWATGGNTVVVLGGYRIHTFTSNGTFTVTSSGTVEVLVVAGGGGGGSLGGGGGGGGMQTGTLAVGAQEYTVTVGAGGAGGSAGACGANGFDSTFGSITSSGGGHGGGDGSVGAPGGSGGGGGNGTAGGAGTAGQGNNGGSNVGATSGAGGGGASQVGAAGSGTTLNGPGGNGGNGAASSISGSSVIYAGGGGGGGRSDNSSNPTVSGGTGGTGGGGNGGNANNSAPAVAGTPNLGGGGGGGGYTTAGGYQTGAAGGSGIVIVRYPI